MNEAEVPINSTTLQQWEYGRHKPSPLAGKLVTKFLDEYPQITGVPEYRNKTKLTGKALRKIRVRRILHRSIFRFTTSVWKR